MKPQISQKQVDELCTMITGKTWEEIQPKTPFEKLLAGYERYKIQQHMIFGEGSLNGTEKISQSFLMAFNLPSNL